MKYLCLTNDKRDHVVRSQKQKVFEALIEIKQKAGCYFCGERCYLCLDFHHVSGEKDFILSKAGITVQIALKEMEKCEVVCSNCHRKVHANILVLEIPRILDLTPMNKILKN